MIYDCFLFFNEFDVLRLRLEELSSVVDQFVLVEATRTFTGSLKRLHFEENKHRFQKHLGKIRHIIVEDTPLKYESPWDMEAHQRNAVLRALTDVAPDDIVIISDVDEVPRASIVTSFSGSPSALELDYFYYRLNCRNLTQKWVAPVVLRGRDLTNPQELRLTACRFWKSNTPVLRDAGWHFSCINDAAGLRLKLQSFSHAECNTPELTDVNTIQNKIRYGLDLVNRRNFCWCCVPLDNSFPRYLLEHQDEFTHILFNFVDFHSERQNLIYSLQDDLNKANRTISQLRDQALQATRQVKEVLHSKSWKVTEPLRSIAHKVRNLYSGRARES
jgi:hypothetical protein